MAVDDNRPPYVMFEFREVEDRTASIAAGHWVGHDVAFAIITRPGSRDTLEKVADVWLNELRERARQGAVPQSWYSAFKESYDQWKKGETGEVSGTPIKGWPVIGPAAQKTLLAAGILSVEDLASLPDNETQLIGMGAIGLKQKAIIWLEQATKGQAVEAQNALKVQLDELAATVKRQASEIDEYKKSVKAKAPI